VKPFFPGVIASSKFIIFIWNSA